MMGLFRKGAALRASGFVRPPFRIALHIRGRQKAAPLFFFLLVRCRPTEAIVYIEGGGRNS